MAARSIYSTTTTADPTVGDAVLAAFDDGERVTGRVRELTKTHATIDVE